MKKYIDILFVCAVFAILVSGLARTLLFPEEINQYENRYANQVPAVTLAGYGDGSVQDAVDAALMDQVIGAQSMKALYNRCTTGFLKESLTALSGRAGNQGDSYVDFNGMQLFGGHYIVYYPRSVSSVQTELDAKIANLNQCFTQHPDLDFYVYYIEKDTDVDFETGESTGMCNYLMQNLTLPEDHKGVYPIRNFKEFSQKFYQTDTHWNYLGAYDGYLSLTKLLHCPGTPLKPSGDAVLVSHGFSGKKAAAVGGEGVFTEDFWAYPFSFPKMTISINGNPAEDYGNQAAYLSGTAAAPVSYGGFYGGDNGETVFSTGSRDRGNLLVLGESFDNAILKLLASHYDHTYSVDLRYYKTFLGRPFDFSAYVAEHNISKVLLMGNIDFYIQDAFNPEG